MLNLLSNIKDQNGSLNEKIVRTLLFLYPTGEEMVQKIEQQVLEFVPTLLQLMPTLENAVETYQLLSVIKSIITKNESVRKLFWVNECVFLKL